MRMTKKRWAATLVSVTAVCFVLVGGSVIWHNLPENQPVNPNPGKSILGEETNVAKELYPMWESQPDGSLLWGYLDDEGNWAVAPVYEMALPFYQGAQVAWVEQNGKYGAISRRGKVVVALDNSTIVKEYRDGYMVAGNGNNSSLYDDEGAKVFGVDGRIGTFNGDLAPFTRRKDGVEQYGLINRRGEIVVEPIYAAISQIATGTPLVKTEEGRVFILKKDGMLGTELLGRVSISNAGGGFAVYQDENGLLGYMAASGSVAVAAHFYVAGPFEKGAAVVKAASGYGLIDTEGHFLVPADYVQGNNLGQGLFAFANNSEGPWTLYNSDGDQLSEAVVCQWGIWEDGALGIQEANVSYLLDRKGKEIAGSRIAGGYSLKKRGGLFYSDGPQSFYYDVQGREIFRQQYRQATIFDSWDVVSELFSPNWYLQMSFPQIYRGKEEYKGLNSLLQEWCLDDYEENYLSETGQYLQIIRGDFTVSCLGSLVEIKYTTETKDIQKQQDNVAISTCVVDLKSGDRFRLENLFESGWKPLVVEKARNAYQSQCENLGQDPQKDVLDMMAQAGWPQRKTPFLLEEEGLALLIGPYDGGQYDQVFISYVDLADKINDNGALWQALSTGDAQE